MSAVFHLTKAAWPNTKKSNFGRIVIISSIHGLFASEFKSAYIAAKHGVIGFTKATALEGAPYNITCNAICPGYVKTPLVENQIADQAKVHNISEDQGVSQIFLKKHAIKKFISVDLIAQTALLFASENTETITGVVMPIDSGWSAE